MPTVWYVAFCACERLHNANLHPKGSYSFPQRSTFGTALDSLFVDKTFLPLLHDITMNSACTVPALKIVWHHSNKEGAAALHLRFGSICGPVRAGWALQKSYSEYRFKLILMEPHINYEPVNVHYMNSVRNPFFLVDEIIQCAYGSFLLESLISFFVWTYAL